MKRTIVAAAQKAAITLVAGMASLLLAGAFAVSPAWAEEVAGDLNWEVTFTGSSMESNYASNAMADVIAGMQPGDSATFKVTLNNDANTAADWYMSNSVIKTLEETREGAEGGAYSYRLSYTNPSGQVNNIYDSDTVGGENDQDALEGLREATGALKDYFYLDNLAAKTKGQVELVVALDGETQGNAYQDTFAQLQLAFAAEPTGTPTAGGTPDTSTEISKVPSGDGSTAKVQTTVPLPQTSDQTRIWLIIFSAVGVIAGVLLVIAFIKLRASNREEE